MLGKVTASGLNVLFVFALLTGCINSEGRSATDSTPVGNVPPTFASASDGVSVAEGSTGVIFTANAEDRNGDTIIYGLTTSSDFAATEDGFQFNINASSGELSFAAPPDFESPGDVDQNNVYEITINAIDGMGGEATQSLQIVVTDDSSEARYENTVFSNTTRSADLTYISDAGVLTQLNVIEPEGDNETNRPLIILASGGGFVSTDRRNIEGLATEYAKAGYVTAVIDYRTLGAVPADANALLIAGADAMHDMAAAVRYFRANATNFRINPNQIVVGGTSAGGIMAANLATADPSDTFSAELTTHFGATGGVYGNRGLNTAESAVPNAALVISGAIFDLGYIDANSAPIYAAHEEFDVVVPCVTGTEGSAGTGLIVSGPCVMLPEYQTLNLPAELYLVAGDSGHVGYTQTETIEFIRGSYSFFANNLINASGG